MYPKCISGFMNYYSSDSPPVLQWAASSVCPSSHWYTAGSFQEGLTPRRHRPPPPHLPSCRPGSHLRKLSRTTLQKYGDLHTQIFWLDKDTLSHQSGLGVQSAELTSEQSILIGSWRLDRRCLCLLNHANLEMKGNNVGFKKRKNSASLNCI